MGVYISMYNVILSEPLCRDTWLCLIIYTYTGGVIGPVCLLLLLHSIGSLVHYIPMSLLRWATRCTGYQIITPDTYHWLRTVWRFVHFFLMTVVTSKMYIYTGINSQ